MTFWTGEYPWQFIIYHLIHKCKPKQITHILKTICGLFANTLFVHNNNKNREPLTQSKMFAALYSQVKQILNLYIFVCVVVRIISEWNGSAMLNDCARSFRTVFFYVLSRVQNEALEKHFDFVILFGAKEFHSTPLFDIRRPAALE